MKKRINFAVIGLGHIGKRHAFEIQKNPLSHLIAVCDIKSKDETAFQGNVPYYTDFRELLQHKNIDVVCICTPNGLHFEHALACLFAYKHVVVEKPLALKRSDCESLLHLALLQNKKIFCVMQNRYSPPIVWLKSILEKNILGNIYLVQTNCYWNRDQRYYQGPTWKGTRNLDGGTLFTQFSHFIDLNYWLFGDIQNITAQFANNNHGETIAFEDTGVVTFDFQKGGKGVITYSTSIWQENFESSITVIGQTGTVKIGGQYCNTLDYCNIEKYLPPVFSESAPQNLYNGYKGSANNHPQVIQNTIDTLQGDASIATNALEGMKVVEIIENIYKLNPYLQ